MTFATETAALTDMLSYRRPAGSKTERAFIHDHLEPLDFTRDGAGNLIKRVGDAPILWSCHTDTVHKQGGRQAVTQNTKTGHLSTSAKGSNCLGADDTAGVWIMAEMIRAHVAGLYVFHRSEEYGGLGSTHIANNSPALLASVKAAVAFDRKGTDEIITHQCGRTCSDAFAGSLASAIGLGHKPSSSGMFTDTANYTHLVGECSNVSVGYRGAHTASETLDATYLIALRDAICVADFSHLDYTRKPGDDNPGDFTFNRDTGALAFDWLADNDDFRDNVLKLPRGRAMARVLRDHPEEIADWLEEYGITATELLEAAYMRGAVIRR